MLGFKGFLCLRVFGFWGFNLDSRVLKGGGSCGVGNLEEAQGALRSSGE